MVNFYGPEEAPEAKELGQKSHEASTRVEGAPYPLGVPFSLVGPRSIVWSSPKASSVSFVQKKNLRK